MLDGIPRNVAQAQALTKSLDVLRVIHLRCTDENAMMLRMRRRALKENRIDDADERVIRNRFDVYHAETYPVLEFYPKSIIAEIDAMGSPAQVFQRVLEVVVPVQDAHFNRPA